MDIHDELFKPIIHNYHSRIDELVDSFRKDVHEALDTVLASGALDATDLEDTYAIPKVVFQIKADHAVFIPEIYRRLYHNLNKFI